MSTQHILQHVSHLQCNCMLGHQSICMLCFDPSSKPACLKCMLFFRQSSNSTLRCRMICKTGRTCLRLSPWQESDQGPKAALAEALTAGHRHAPERKHLVAIAVGAEITGGMVVVPHVSRRVRSADYMTPHAFVDETDRPGLASFTCQGS